MPLTRVIFAWTASGFALAFALALRELAVRADWRSDRRLAGTPRWRLYFFIANARTSPGRSSPVPSLHDRPCHRRACRRRAPSGTGHLHRGLCPRPWPSSWPSCCVFCAWPWRGTSMTSPLPTGLCHTHTSAYLFFNHWTIPCYIHLLDHFGMPKAPPRTRTDSSSGLHSQTQS